MNSEYSFDESLLEEISAEVVSSSEPEVIEKVDEKELFKSNEETRNKIEKERSISINKSQPRETPPSRKEEKREKLSFFSGGGSSIDELFEEKEKVEKKDSFYSRSSSSETRNGQNNGNSYGWSYSSSSPVRAKDDDDVLVADRVDKVLNDLLEKAHQKGKRKFRAKKKSTAHKTNIFFMHRYEMKARCNAQINRDEKIIDDRARVLIRRKEKLTVKLNKWSGILRSLINSKEERKYLRQRELQRMSASTTRNQGYRSAWY